MSLRSPSASFVPLKAAAVLGASASVVALWALRRRWLKSTRAANYNRHFDDAGDGELNRVAFTSRWVAAERAIESARADALFKDEFAAALGGESGRAYSAKMCGIMKKVHGWAEHHITWMAVRTKYIDDQIATFAKAQPAGFQIVNLGSGLDTRPFRMECLRSCRAFFEVDVAEVIIAKDAAMHRLGAAAVCPRSVLSVDLTDSGRLAKALRAAGYDVGTPTFWLLEGLTMYVPETVNAAILAAASSLSPRGSVLCSGFIGDATKLPAGIPYTPTPSKYAGLAASCGWGELVVARYGDPELNFGRYPEGRAPDASQCFGLATKP